MSLSYEICKQLKEVGLEQHLFMGDGFFMEEYGEGGLPYVWRNEYLIGDYYNMRTKIKIPRLSELIEACGNINLQLERYPKNRDECKWTAICDGCSGEALPSPEMAVAKLYLKLNPQRNVA